MFTHDEEKLINEALSRLAKDLKQEGNLEGIEDIWRIRAKLKKGFYMQMVEEDIALNAENHDIELTEDQIKEVAKYVVNGYDHSDYNEYIEHVLTHEFGFQSVVDE